MTMKSEWFAMFDLKNGLVIPFEYEILFFKIKVG